jgi:hypothetical protein
MIICSAIGDQMSLQIYQMLEAENYYWIYGGCFAHLGKDLVKVHLEKIYFVAKWQL